MEFIPNPQIEYTYDYEKMADGIKAGKWSAEAVFREMCRKDHFFMGYFIYGAKLLNCPFGIQVCKELDEEDWTHTKPILDIWARGHMKSLLITQVGTTMRILREPDKTTGILSYSKSAAEKLMRPIKETLANSEFLKKLFPDILYSNPTREAPKWADQSGITVKRKSLVKECTVEAWGMIEGMPTGSHFDDIILDDIETHDTAKSVEVTQGLISSYSMVKNLGSYNYRHRAIGTTYSHMGLIEELRKKKRLDKTPVYFVRCKPATHDGTKNGVPVFLSKETLEDLKLEPHFAAQQLLDPSPQTERKLHFDNIKHVIPSEVPLHRLWKFIVIDPAVGNSNKKAAKEDFWAIHSIGVLPRRDKEGASNIYLLDSLIAKMEHDKAMDEIVRFYLRQGRVRAIGIEKAGQSTAEIHITKALLSKGIIISEKAGTLVLLTPKKRNKEQRIIENLQWSLSHGKVHFLTTLDAPIVSHFKQEMDKFPFWHDDALDSFAYGIEMIKDYHFPEYEDDEDLMEDDDFTDAYDKDNTSKYNKNGWMAC